MTTKTTITMASTIKGDIVIDKKNNLYIILNKYILTLCNEEFLTIPKQFVKQEELVYKINYSNPYIAKTIYGTMILLNLNKDGIFNKGLGLSSSNQVECSPITKESISGFQSIKRLIERYKDG